jgi:hypothetical protein
MCCCVVSPCRPQHCTLELQASFITTTLLHLVFVLALLWSADYYTACACARTALPAWRSWCTAHDHTMAALSRRVHCLQLQINNARVSWAGPCARLCTALHLGWQAVTGLCFDGCAEGVVCEHFFAGWAAPDTCGTFCYSMSHAGAGLARTAAGVPISQLAF